MEGKLSQTASITKKCKAEQQDPGFPNFNKPPQSYKRWKDINEGIKTGKDPQYQFTEKDNAILDGDEIEQFADDGLKTVDVDLNYESAPQRNDLGFIYAEKALGAQPTKGDHMNKDNVEAPSTADSQQTVMSKNQKETSAPIDDTYISNRSLLLSFKFHWVRSIYLGQVKLLCSKVNSFYAFIQLIVSNHRWTTKYKSNTMIHD
ncbi:hypothetical protein GIB67_012088 [Kingdonia uniflora]|uniref:Uncharacterized protein n=1 Tax=Kingdonia uniflora TaxID=39325 RepID=A0A7J7LI63_9MAGN|nr:hypothetical protein GIB67_012088 [Kingdonia uniflora]